MSLQFEGKVAFITGAARGQGRSHAVRFAEDGADIIAFDLCDQIDSVAYPMATRDDLHETVNLVEKTGRRIVAEQGDVRDLERLKAAVANGVAELGRSTSYSPMPASCPPLRTALRDVGLHRRGGRLAQRCLLHGGGGAARDVGARRGRGDRHHQLGRRIEQRVPEVQRPKSWLCRLSRRQTRRRRTDALLRNHVGGKEYSRQYQPSDTTSNERLIQERS
jgi:short chain dehydrogenase